MSASIKTIKRGASEALKGYQQRALSLQSVLNNQVLDTYRNLQRTRWMTENASEGTRWNILKDKRWKQVKHRLYGSNLETGRPLLVASGRLQKSVIGPGEGFRKVTLGNRIIISTSVEYAKGVDDLRPFTGWSKQSLAKFRKIIGEYILKKKLKVYS